MACGCAVVSTDNGGIRDFTVQGKTALLSPPKNPKLLAQNLIQLLKDDSLRIQIARAAYSYIQKFSWEKSVNQMESLLQEKTSFSTTP